MNILVKSKYDTRDYAHIKLKNNLNVILISDKEADFSAASMVVNVGYFFDTVPGIAHFLEHMLFLGSKKYESEDIYNHYLKVNGGVSNAYTAADKTCYYFNIQKHGFEHALDMFAHFFIDPTFKKDAVDREINAVDSEYRKNINTDAWAMLDIIKSQCSTKHPYSQFSTGSKESLSVKNIYIKLKEFHHNFYTASNMNLVIVHNTPIKDMADLVTKTFEEIPNNNSVKKLSLKFPLEFNVNTSNLSDLTVPKFIQYVPINDHEQIFLLWQLPSEYKYYKYKPLSYINNILENRSKQGLYQYLYAAGLIYDFNTNVIDEFYDITLYSIAVTLTKKGFQYKNSICKLIMLYIKSIKKKLSHKWMYNEHKLINKISFVYGQKEDPLDIVIKISEDFTHYPTEDIVCHEAIYNSFDQTTIDLINKYIDHMSQSNTVVFYISKEYKKTKHISKWHSAHYNIYNDINISSIEDDYPDTIISDFFNNFDFIMKKNIYIPKEKIQILICNDNITLPKLITQKKNYNVYNLPNTKFNEPYNYIFINIFSNKLNTSASNNIETIFFITLLRKILEEDLYLSSQLNTYYKIHILNDQLVILFGGFKETLLKIYAKCLTLFNNPDYSQMEKFFHLEKVNYKQKLSNKRYEQPYSHTNELYNKAILPNFYTFEEKIAVVDNITFDNILNIHKRFSDNIFVNCFIGGTIQDDVLKQIVTHIEQLCSNNEHSEYNCDLSFNNIENNTRKVIPTFNNNDINSAVNVVVAYDVIDRREHIKLWVKKLCMIYFIDQIITQPFFDILRTKEQLGYIVRSNLHETNLNKYTYLCHSFVIQSPHKTVEELEERVLRFFKYFYKNKILKIDDSILDSIKKTFVKNLSRVFNNFHEEFIFYCKEIELNTYIFDIHKQMASACKTITIADLQHFFESCYINDTKKITLYGVAATKKN